MRKADDEMMTERQTALALKAGMVEFTEMCEELCPANTRTQSFKQ